MRSASDFTGAAFDCACGRRHTVDIGRIGIGEGVLSSLPAAIPPGVIRVLVVADVNTFEACGRQVADILSPHVKTDVYVFPDTHLLPDEYAVGRILVHLEPDVGLIVAVGSGSINDLCRYVSFCARIPYIICATAPSMDGYAAKGSPLLIDGMKLTRYAHYTLAVFADIGVLARAPSQLYAAGVGDILGKFTALADWKLASINVGEYYCPFCADLMQEALTSVVENIQQGNTGKQAVGTLLDALLISGLAMGMAGVTRPASGAEHHLAHYLEAAKLKKGLGHLSHGEAVGVAELVILRLYAHMKPYLPEGVEVPPVEYVESLLVKAGCKTHPSQIGVDSAILYDSLLHAMEYRLEFYSILRFAAEKGVLESFAKEYK